MLRQLLWWTALLFVLSAFGCFGRMMVLVVGLLSEIPGSPTFAAIVPLIAEGRVWGWTGVGLFLAGLVLLWFVPDAGQPEEPEIKRP